MRAITDKYDLLHRYVRMYFTGEADSRLSFNQSYPYSYYGKDKLWDQCIKHWDRLLLPNDEDRKFYRRLLSLMPFDKRGNWTEDEDETCEKICLTLMSLLRNTNCRKWTKKHNNIFLFVSLCREVVNLNTVYLNGRKREC